MKTILDLRPHETGEVAGIARCGKARKRLYELGLTRGNKVKVIKNDRGSPVILRVNGFTVAISRCLASKVEIKEDE